LQTKYADHGLVILGFSVDEAGPEAVKKFAVEQKMNYPVLMADGATVAAFGGIQGIPTTFLIDREGRVRDRKVGSMHAAAYEARIVPVLRESVPSASTGTASVAAPSPVPVAR
jgi:peroxiredoxin